MLYCLNSAVYCQRKCLKELKETCWEFLKRTGLFYTGLRNCLWMSLDQKKGGFRSMDCLCSSWMSHLLFQQDQCWLLLNYWTEYLVMWSLFVFQPGWRDFLFISCTSKMFCINMRSELITLLGCFLFSLFKSKVVLVLSFWWSEWWPTKEITACVIPW